MSNTPLEEHWGILLLPCFPRLFVCCSVVYYHSWNLPLCHTNDPVKISRQVFWGVGQLSTLSWLQEECGITWHHHVVNDTLIFNIWPSIRNNAGKLILLQSGVNLGLNFLVSTLQQLAAQILLCWKLDIRANFFSDCSKWGSSILANGIADM